MDEPTRFERIEKLASQIERINNTIYPDKYYEVRDTMVTALKERIHAIVDGKV